MKLWIISGFCLILGFTAGYLIRLNQNNDQPFLSPLLPDPTPRPLLKYSFTNLKNYQPVPSKINISEIQSEDEVRKVFLASYQTGTKTMSMQIMVPQTATPASGFPAILMIRGYVDPEQYQSGIGTKNAANLLSANGFVTIAPDFLGFGKSDPPPQDTIEARLERPRQMLDLIASLNSLTVINTKKLGMWGHSNGGQISLSLLEVTSKPIPTVLWAPVSKPFPYSILYYTDESPDEGKALRKTVAQFEEDYDILDFTIGRRFEKITAPIEIHQGTADDAVPVEWSNELAAKLRLSNPNITYYTYPGADHNLRPSWDTVAARSLAFFIKYLYVND